MVKKIKNAPGWLALSADRTSFLYVPARAEIVQRIYELSIRGFGGYAIAKLLNQKQVPAFGTSKRWDPSTIHNMLTNRAALGEYQRKQTINGKEEPVGDPVPGYYPAVIDVATFEAAQIARQKNMAARSGRRGKVITNLFSGLACCYYCQQPMKFYSNGEDKSLICAAVTAGRRDCPRFAWSYRDFEDLFFVTVQQVRRYPEFSRILSVLGSSVEEQNEANLLEARMDMMNFLRSAVKSVSIAVAGAEPPAPKPHLVIYRDHQARFFEVIFLDTFSLIGCPRLPEPTGLKIPSIDLEKRFGLSPRQAQITALLVQGFTLKQAAGKLDQTLETGRWHLREIFRRTNTHSQSELIGLAQRSCDECAEVRAAPDGGHPESGR